MTLYLLVTTMDAFDFYGWESNERYDDTRDDTDNDTWATDDGWSDSSSSSSGMYYTVCHSYCLINFNNRL